MADGVLGRDDIEFLLDIARHDPDARCRIAALRAVAALPLAEPARAAAAGVVQGLLNHPAAAVAEAARHAADGLIPVPTPPSSARPSAGQPAELASTVRDRLLARTGFPAQLTALGDLSDLESRRLLTDLLTQLLTADQPAGEATERLGRVLQTLRRDGSRVVTASLPPLPLDSVPASRSWLGGLLALGEPEDLGGLDQSQ